MKAAILMRAEELSDHADSNASEMLHFGFIPTKEEMVKGIDTVTKQQVMAFAKKLFKSTPTVSALGPIDNMMPYKDIIARLKG